MAEPRFIREPRFAQWLYYQQDRADSIGGLARFVFTEKEKACWPITATTVEHLVMHLRNMHALEKHVPHEIAVRNAFSEFRRFLATGGQVPARPGGNRPSGRPKAHRSFFVPRVMIEQLNELAAHDGITQGEILERLVGREHARVLRSARR